MLSLLLMGYWMVVYAICWASRPACTHVYVADPCASGIRSPPSPLSTQQNLRSIRESFYTPMRWRMPSSTANYAIPTITTTTQLQQRLSNPHGAAPHVQYSFACRQAYLERSCGPGHSHRTLSRSGPQPAWNYTLHEQQGTYRRLAQQCQRHPLHYS